MLIYNHKKEFIGIDEVSLMSLSLSSIAELQSEASDFADLFVKSPGFIHNFKHIHWIDYVTCNDNGMDSKAIIKIRDKSYSTNIQISTMYLLENPTQKAFMVELINLKPLSHTQEDLILISPFSKEELQNNNVNATALKEELIYENISSSIVKDSHEDNIDEINYTPSSKPDNVKIELEDLSWKPDTIIKIEPLEKEEILTSLAELKHEHIDDNDSYFSRYSYEPQIVSEELGLPIDLIEEFIQDFIAQAESFKHDLYNSLAQGSMDTLKTQSHKLKGVAANLRIEDALDALTIVNSSHDEYEIQKNIKRFYNIIDKLSKNSTKESKSVTFSNKEEIAEEDDFVISFKDELPTKNHVEILNLDVCDSIKIIEVLKYDRDKVAHELGLSIDSFNELFNDYLTEVKVISVVMNEALERNDLSECKNNARKLKSMSENMRIHDFDPYLENIINAISIDNIKKDVKNIALVLDLISKTETK